MPENNNKNYIINEDLGELRYLSAMHMKNTVAQFMVGIGAILIAQSATT